ncbi:MAG: BON domain-containing protein [Myxococcota bacterium]
MNRHVLFSLVLSAGTLTLAGCQDEIDTPREAAHGDAKPHDGKPHDATPHDGDRNDVPAAATADNTARNERDRDGATMTPFDQSESGPDIEITAQIRRAVVGAENLSANADNVKIMTSAGVVTLRGPVATDAEKASIEAMAKAVAGVTRVDNQLEVAPH